MSKTDSPDLSGTGRRALYEQGNRQFVDSQFEAAAGSYSRCIDLQAPRETLSIEVGSEADVLTSALLNRAQCFMNLREYRNVVKDCAEVLKISDLIAQSIPISFSNVSHDSRPSLIPFHVKRAKALIRSSLAREYLGEYNLGFDEIESALGVPGLPSSLIKVALPLRSRLKALIDADRNICKTQGVPAMLVTSSQAIRLNIIEHPEARIVSDNSRANECSFKICIGNEFGLWSRDLLDAFSDEGLSRCRLKCDVVNMGSRHFQMAEVENDGNIIWCSLIGDTSLNRSGKFDISVDIKSTTTSSMSSTSSIILLRFSLSIDALPGMFPVVPVLSLPIIVSNLWNETSIESRAAITNRFPIHSACIPIEASSIREVTVKGLNTDVKGGRNDVIYGFECPFSLGIGGKLWDSTFVMLDYLHNSQSADSGSISSGSHPLSDADVIELGCGTGVLSLSLMLMSPPISSSVSTTPLITLTDMPAVVPLIEANISLNQFILNKNKSKSGPNDIKRGGFNVNTDSSDAWTFAAKAHLWGSNTADLVRSNGARRLVVLASDVVYDPSGYLPLVTSLRSLLQGDSSEAGSARDVSSAQYRERVCYLAFRHRHPDDARFFEYLKEANLLLTICYEKTAEVQENDKNALNDIKIFKIVCSAN